VKPKNNPLKPSAGEAALPRTKSWLSILTWVFAAVIVALLVSLLINRKPAVLAVFEKEEAVQSAPVEANQPDPSTENAANAAMPSIAFVESSDTISRTTDSHTIIPSRPRDTIIEYTVEKGDAIFSIANKYEIKPETVLWANYSLLNDNPDEVSVGMVLKIPAVDGVYYEWEENDTIESVADKFSTTPEKIITFSGNKLDLTNPEIEPGTYVMVPDGIREFRQWLVPTIWREKAGANQSIAGGCSIPDGGPVGSGAFIWPSYNHFLSGNDYWSGHLGIDIAAGLGDPLYAVDNGVIVYASSISGGYGNMVMIDHGNGYHSLYAHLSDFNSYCGQSVYQGQVIGYAGSTGNSTGTHLHFEIRYNGGFINPWYVLP
jgi:murein DD-endopeptidase MepM/ murein hydrolase activator NlpD